MRSGDENCGDSASCLSTIREPVAADWPELLAIVEEKVKPARSQSSQRSKSSHGRRAGIWWQLYHQAKDLQAAI